MQHAQMRCAVCNDESSLHAESPTSAMQVPYVTCVPCDTGSMRTRATDRQRWHHGRSQPRSAQEAHDSPTDVYRTSVCRRAGRRPRGCRRDPQRRAQRPGIARLTDTRRPLGGRRCVQAASVHEPLRSPHRQNSRGREAHGVQTTSALPATPAEGEYPWRPWDQPCARGGPRARGRRQGCRWSRSRTGRSRHAASSCRAAGSTARAMPTRRSRIWEHRTATRASTTRTSGVRTPSRTASSMP